MKSPKRINKILKIKEFLAKAKLKKTQDTISKSSSSINSLTDYSQAYVVATRSKKDLTAYEMNNIISMNKNIKNIVQKENLALTTLKHVYNRQKDDWYKAKSILDKNTELFEKIGTENALEEEEKEIDKIISIKMITRYSESER